MTKKSLNDRGYQAELEYHVFARRLRRLESLVFDSVEGVWNLDVNNETHTVDLGSTLVVLTERIDTLLQDGILTLSNVYRLFNSEYFLAEDDQGDPVALFKYNSDHELEFDVPIRLTGISEVVYAQKVLVEDQNGNVQKISAGAFYQRMPVDYTQNFLLMGG